MLDKHQLRMMVNVSDLEKHFATPTEFQRFLNRPIEFIGPWQVCCIDARRL